MAKKNHIIIVIISGKRSQLTNGKRKKNSFVSFNFENLLNIFFSYFLFICFLFLLDCASGIACAEKVFSFLSQDEVEKLKQEEEKKIETLKRDKKNKKILKATDGNSLEEGNDNVDGTSSDDDDDDDDESPDDDDIHAGDSRDSR